MAKGTGIKNVDDQLTAIKAKLHLYCKEHEIDNLGEYEGGGDSGGFEFSDDLKDFFEQNEDLDAHDLLYDHIADNLGYYGYAFEGDVHGQVNFDIETGKFQISGKESETVYIERSEEFD